jgi:hypothetical protein
MLDRFAFAEHIQNELCEANRISRHTRFIPGTFSRSVSRPAAKEILHHARQHTHTVFNCGTLHHAMLMELVKDPRVPGRAQTFTVRLYNSGSGLHANHAHRGHSENGSRKYETMFEVTGAQLGDGPGLISEDLILKVLERTVRVKYELADGGVDKLYRLVASLGRENNNLPMRRAQTRQRGGTCTLESLLAYLRNHMSELQYKFAKGALCQAAAMRLRAHASARDAAMAAKLEAKALRTREKGMHTHACNLEAERNASTTWFHRHVWPEKVDEQVSRQARAKQRSTFAMYQHPDFPRELVLVWATAAGATAHEKLSFDWRTGHVRAAGFPQETFFGVSALAERLHASGATPLGAP